MPSQITNLGAGLPGVKANGDQGGGNKKGGLPPTKVNKFVLCAIARNAYSSPRQRAQVFCTNQLSGGVGPNSRLFSTRGDGVNKNNCKESKVKARPRVYFNTGAC
jgi:hypothetical protein